MPYATSQDFINAFGKPETIQLTNLDTPSAIAPDLVPLNKALADAEALMNTYFGSRYVLPLANNGVAVVPTIVNRYCIDIARYMLDRIQSREDVRQRYEDILKWMEQLVKGLVSLGTDTIAGQNVESLASGLGATGARSYAEPPIDMKGFGFG
jgi:phage gp36-like protein